MDAQQWMGAVRMKVQTADKNINNPAWKVKICVFVRNKSIIKHESFIQIAFSSENVVLYDSGEKYTQIKHLLQAKKNCSDQICYIITFQFWL